MGTCSWKLGAGRWIGMRGTSGGIGAPPSTGSPSRLNIRPRVASPTGTEIGPPVSTASSPRTRPSVASSATVRTVLLPRCCWTSHTSWPPVRRRIVSAVRISGR